MGWVGGHAVAHKREGGQGTGGVRANQTRVQCRTTRLLTREDRELSCRANPQSPLES